MVFCYQKMLAFDIREKNFINHKNDMNFLMKLNDYTTWDLVNEKQPAFDYFAAAEIDNVENVLKGMEIKELLASKDIVFRFRAECKDSLQPIADYIYKVWFPQSSCHTLHSMTLQSMAKAQITTEKI